MAEAHSRTETVETVIGVNLELTPAEARTLAVVLSHVGGSVDNSPRKHMSEISAALYKVGIKYFESDERHLLQSHHSLYFDTYPKEAPLDGTSWEFD